MRAVAIAPAAAVLVGSVVGLHLDAGPWLRWCLPAVWIAAAVLWATCRPVAGVVITCVGFAACGWLLSLSARDEALHSSLRRELDRVYGGFAIEAPAPGRQFEPVPTRAVLNEDAARAGDVVSLRTRVVAVMLGGRWRPAAGGVTIAVGGAIAPRRTAGWRAGRTIELPVLFRRPATYLDDGVADAERDLALAGTTLLGSTKSGLLVEVRARAAWVDERAADIRAFVRDAVARRVAPWDPVAAAIVTAVLIGDRTGLPDEVRERLQAAGTYHVIAISGGNIAILAAATMAALVVLLIRGRVAAACTIVVLIAYAQVVTGGPSVSRATVMAVAYLTARLADHRTPAWQATALAAAVLVVWRPLDVRDVGFVLTFGATAALIECAGRLVSSSSAPSGASTRGAWQQPAAWIAGSLAASLATEIALMPVSATIFSRVTSAGLVLNLVAVPVMAVVQVAGMVAVLGDRLSTIAVPAGWAAYAGAATLTGSARLVDIARWLTMRVPPPALWLVAAYYGALFVALFVRRRRTRLSGIVVGVAAAIAIVAGFPSAGSRPQGRTLRWTVFDVGQGDASLLQWGGRAIAVDAGGAPFGGGFDVGGRVLAPAIWARGARRLDALAITHGDPDHMGGAPVLIDIFAPRAMWLGIPVPARAPEQVLLDRASTMHVAVEARRSGQELVLDGVRLRVLHPPAPDWERRRVRNDDSIVIEVVYGDVALLLTGDISASIEREIVPRLTPARVRILKVAHHGSRTSTSSELLDTWRPQIAVISCGRGNTFGHPAPDVVARLEAIGARIYRTDRDGEVTLETEGNEVRVRTYAGRR